MNPELLTRLHALEGVPSALAAARDGIDAMLRDRGLRRTTPETTAESLLRGAHASAVLEGSASTLDEVRAGAGDEVARGVGAVVDRAAVAGAGADAARRCRRSPGCTRSSAPGRCPTTLLGRPRDAESAAGCCGRSARLRHRRRAGAAGRRGRARRAAGRRAVRLPQRDRGARRRAAGAGRARPGREVAGRARRPGTSRCARRTRRTLAGLARRRPAGPVHAWLLYAAEAYAAGAEASPLRDAAARCEPVARTCERHPTQKTRVPPLTRETRLPGVHLSVAAPGSIPDDRRPVGRVDRRVGTWLTCGSVELSVTPWSTPARATVQDLISGPAWGPACRSAPRAAPARAAPDQPADGERPADRERRQGRRAGRQRHPAAQRHRLGEDQHRPAP